MDDLLGEDWQAPKKTTATKSSVPLNPNTFASQYSSFRNSPTIPSSGLTSARSTPQPPSTASTGTKPPSGDSFGNLFSSKIQKQTTNVSIQERQRQIEEERRRQQDEQSRLWNDLGSGRGTPEIRGTSLAPITRPADEDENDILAAFNKAAPVNKATYFPPPDSGPVSRGSTPALSQVAPSLTVNDNDDDDPFGLGNLPQRPSNHFPSRPLQRKNDDDDDDILGDLGRPMIERDPTVAPSFSEPEDDAPELPHGDAPLDRAVAELVDMGFPADNARIALIESGGGVQGAVSWLLQQAHEESRAKSRGEGIERQRSPNGRMSPPRRRREEDPSPSWMRQDDRSSSIPRRQDSRSPAGHEKDVSQVAQEFGSKFLKGANSLWKASQKQMAKTMSEFQQDREPNQPKWMQESSGSSSRSSSRRPPEARADVEVTNEAALLDMPRERSAKPLRQTAPQRVTEQPVLNRRPEESTSQRLSPQPRFMQQTPPVQDKRPTTKLSRQDVEEQSAQAYVSPARRRRPTPKPETTPEPEVDLFSPSPPQAPPTSIRTNGASSNPGRASPAPRPSPAPSKPKAPPRNIPSVSPSALATSANHRKVGGEAFKRGDYASAHESYTAALSPLPPTHPVLIIVLSNRALTALKTGDAKTAVSDADQALALIGASQGVGETIDLGGGGAEGPKDMREFYGKALMRKAEALEHLEKWADAAAVWRQAVGAGVGGAVSLRGRDRCERTAAPKPPATKPPPARAPAVASRSGAGASAKGPSKPIPRPALSSAASAEAVKKLRAANAAADKADDERFQLADQVDAKLSTWKGGKADNLRALLQSLDAVLWPAAGWKKVGMSDLVMPNKVKIVYMKAIAKVHPDKISQDATTEEKMISAAVFSTLNEAWDKFKKDNNL